MTIEEYTGAAPGRLLGLESAATYLDTTERSIRRLIERGVLQPVKIPTLRRVLLDREDLDRLINAAKAEATV
jgi:excisionase family DNA binding protein